jgi:glutamine synthetase
MVFGDRAMRERLPKETYKMLHQTIRDGKPLDPGIAGVVANAMKDWAVERGVTHFTHWFQPLTGVTAEKHDSFISPAPDGNMIIEFSGKDLVRGEPDASSFPSGGLRATFEARGYTAWDPTSYAFIKEGILCIPTAFYSYGGEALDKKTPLLRSMECISEQAVRLLRLLGDEGVTGVSTTIGPEQEYFLVDKELYGRRRDLVFCGRTLFGAKPPKGQEMDDHYFGAIKPRVLAFMKDLNRELWQLGILAKTEHNEVAPAQHELAPVYTTTNIGTDHNQLTMELMKKVADRHGLACLLHEKPFAGVNGSGKHNNWSISTSTGENLLEPGDDPFRNMRFLVFLAAIIAAVDEYQDLLRVSVASIGNDHRLGANEAPPAIVSIFLGDELTAVLDAIETGASKAQSEQQFMQLGVKILPDIAKDNTDRNRTSPFAFTGNKFEFRMLGSSFSVSEPNIVLNTIVAELLSQFAERLEREGASSENIFSLIKETVAAHKRILFNGNNYADEWVAEAARRGLLNLQTTVEALPYFVREKNVALFAKHGIFTEEEMHSRYEILVESYVKAMNIEALTLLDITRSQIIPAVSAYAGQLAGSAASQQALLPGLQCVLERELVARISGLAARLYERTDALEKAVRGAKSAEGGGGALASAEYYRDRVFAGMEALRETIDEIEPLIAREAWPFPTYGDLLFNV